MSLTSIAHQRVGATLVPGTDAVDATAGNGHDTLFLARSLGAGGRVMAIDIQATAIEQTRRRLADHAVLDQVNLIQGDHRYMLDFAKRMGLDSIHAVMFNLGYHPGGKRHITTTAPSSLAAIEAATELLSASGGILSVIAYRGHPGGQEETARVSETLYVKHQQLASQAGLEVIETDYRAGPVLYLLTLSSAIKGAQK